jgi:hypothetical protein
LGSWSKRKKLNKISLGVFTYILKYSLSVASIDLFGEQTTCEAGISKWHPHKNRTRNPIWK